MTLPVIGPIVLDRVTLRAVAEADLPDLMAVNGDDEVTRFLPYPTWVSPADGAAWLARMETLAADGGGRQLVIVRHADSQVIGTALVFRHDEGSRRVELGYVLGRPHWGQGYAAEALRGLLDHLFTAVGIRRVEAEVDPANTASDALLRRLGFTCEGLRRDRWEAKGRTYGTQMYGLLASEWTAAPAARPAAVAVQAITPDREVLTTQRLPYFVGISGGTVGATGLSMHLVVIPPGGRSQPHLHVGYETGIYVLEGRVLTRWGEALEHEVVSTAGEFLFVPPGVPHEATNLSATHPARAVVARNDPAEQDKVRPVALGMHGPVEAAPVADPSPGPVPYQGDDR